MHEAEGPFVFAVFGDLTLVVLAAIWVFATNAIFIEYRKVRTFSWMFCWVYMLPQHITYASLGHMHEIYVTHVRGVKYEEGSARKGLHRDRFESLWV